MGVVSLLSVGIMYRRFCIVLLSFEFCDYLHLCHTWPVWGGTYFVIRMEKGTRPVVEIQKFSTLIHPVAAILALQC
jgi:hypothetical protein